MGDEWAVAIEASRIHEAPVVTLTSRGHLVEMPDARTIRDGGTRGIAVETATDVMNGAADYCRDGVPVAPLNSLSIDEVTKPVSDRDSA